MTAVKIQGAMTLSWHSCINQTTAKKRERERERDKRCANGGVNRKQEKHDRMDLLKTSNTIK